MILNVVYRDRNICPGKRILIYIFLNRHILSFNNIVHYVVGMSKELSVSGSNFCLIWCSHNASGALWWGRRLHTYGICPMYLRSKQAVTLHLRYCTRDPWALDRRMQLSSYSSSSHAWKIARVIVNQRLRISLVSSW